MIFRMPLFLLFLVSYMSIAAAQDEDGFRPLFNGKNLDGWVLVNTPKDTWSVKDGMLLCTGKPIGELRTDRMYQNFILEVEWRHMKPRGNAGIFVWADDITARGVPFHRSIEVQVLENAYGNTRSHTTHGDIFPIHGAKMTPINGRGGSRAFPSENRSKPSPEWNHYRITCEDGNISLAVNGKVVTRGKDASPRKGYICLESEGGIVHYRNLRIKELPDTPVADEHMAIANRGYHSIYSGLDLRGWNLADAAKTDWQPRDWVLAFTGSERTKDNELFTRVPDHFGFLFDVRPKEKTESIWVGFTTGAPISEANGFEIRVKDHAAANRWSRVEGQVKGGRLTVAIDGKPLADHQLKGDGVTFHLAPTGPADFANLYIRHLDEK